MGKITHADIGTQLTKTEWEANTTHLDSQDNTLEVSRSATLVVAASDASVKSKAGADYVCDNTADNVEIQAAIDLNTNGLIQLSEGTFNLSGNLSIGSPTRRGTVRGQGDGTILNVSAPDKRIDIYPQGRLQNLYIEVGNDASYTGNLIIVRGVNESAQDLENFHKKTKILDNLYLRNRGAFGGRAIWLLAAGTVAGVRNFIGLNTFGPLQIMNFNYGVYLTADTAVAEPGKAFVNGNIFESIIAHGVGYSVFLDKENNCAVHGNIFKSIGIQSGNSVKGIYCEGGGNQFQNVFIWDWTAPNAVEFTATANRNRIYGYLTPNVTDAGTKNIIKDNVGYITENSGTATITAGQTSVAVTHGLAATPTRVILTPTTDTAGRRYWVSAKGATTFTITIDSTYTSDITFDWRAQIGEG